MLRFSEYVALFHDKFPLSMSRFLLCELNFTRKSLVVPSKQLRKFSEENFSPFEFTLSS